MSDAYTGGCACGRVRYAISAEPIFMNDCQCRDCQQASGTGHGSYLTFPSRAQVKVGGRTLDQWQYDTRSIKVASAGRAAAGIPSDAVAYRMGDMVFTHLGMDPTDPKWGSSKLWVMVMWPDGLPTPTGLIHAGCADGTVHEFHPSAVGTELAAQNQLRATFGLAPLPVPLTVPQGQAVGAGGADNSGTP